MTTPYPHLATIAEISRLAGLAPADPIRQSLDSARAQARAYQFLWNTPLPATGGAAIVDTVTAGGARVRLHIHYPDDRRHDVPVLLYFHGGGFVLNGADTHERLMRLLAVRSGVAVAGATYSLAPETRFPGQITEARTAIRWLRENGHTVGLDGNTIAVGGDSAGATLALSLSLSLRAAALPLPRLGLLFYGMFSADLDSPSHQAYGGGGFGLTTERVDWFWRQYLSDPQLRRHPLAAPLLADLHGLPHQHIIGAGLDCLLDDSVALAHKLELAGVSHRLSVHDGVPHSFMQMSAHLPPADQAITEAAETLRLYLQPGTRQAAE